MMGGPTRRTALHPAHAAARRVVGVLVAAVAGLVLLPGVAAADVTVAAPGAAAGARDVTITFRVTDDDHAAPVTRLQVFLPAVRPLVGVAPAAPPGWAVAVEGPPAAPVAITWEGGPGGGEFAVAVARLPDGAGPLRFRVVQTDARGGTVEWSDLVPVGAPAPAHPALVVPYAASGVAAEVPAPRPADHHHGAPPVLPAGTGSAGRTVAVAALVAVVVAVWARALGRRQRRRLAALRGSGPAHRP